MVYAGIGSRETPEGMLTFLESLAESLAQRGHVLRSGHARGADTAFEVGARRGDGEVEIYLPWPSFEGGVDDPALLGPTEEAMEIAEEFHPAWPHLSRAARKLHGRNTHQVLGADCESPADFVLCWTPPKGGTTQALRIAHARRIPVVNFYAEGEEYALEDPRGGC